MASMTSGERRCSPSPVRVRMKTRPRFSMEHILDGFLSGMRNENRNQEDSVLEFVESGGELKGFYRAF